MEIKLPELGENIAQGTISKILVKVGDNVKKGQNILELETDKAVLEVPSPDEGSVSQILVKAGQAVKVGQAIFVFAGKAGASAPSSPAPEAKAAAAPAPQAQPAAKPAASSAAPASAPSGAVVEMKLPGLGENIAQGTVTKILVKKGDAIKKGQNIVELETDKAVLEVPSSMDGVIEDILIKTGQVVKVGAPAFKIKGGSAAPQGASAPAPQPASAPSAVKSETKAAAVSAPAPSQKMVAEPAKNVAAAPSVRRFAREIGLDIAVVAGSGPGGRISVEDVKEHAKRILISGGTAAGGGSAPASLPLPDFSKWGTTERQPMNNVRKKTAEHLTHAWQSIPHVTQFDKADITELEKLRKRLSTKESKMSITPFIIKVVAAALKNFPQFNASVDMATNEVVYKKYVNIGVAVDTDRGLLVPVLKNVDQMSIKQISNELTAIAEKARNRKTTLDEMQGGSFTISNLGGIGGAFFTPIVNWPEVAILGVSRGAMEPVYTESQFVPRLMLPVSLSYDHRLIDGADGARFIRWVCDAIQQPFLLDLEK
ncbi:MAG: 2-oxo acid dehydrogenase subunit E2 [Candidatus Omnitrophica bacterium]|nr:2-oxo acid dehydrogenase subunit E2 [Candidatus Omnitrophota bacterium]